MNTPIKIFTVSEMVAAEKAADAAGVTYHQMMETAGRCVAEAINGRFPITEMNVLVLVGPGNNGGDGLVAGRYLAQAGANVAFYLSKPRDPATDANYAQIQEMGLFAVDASFDQRFRVLRTRLNITDLVIDALLGTGVSRPIGGKLAQLMRQLQAGIVERQTTLAATNRPRLTSIAQVAATTPNPLPVVAVDCPSGLNCDTGALDSLAIPAQLTVTFAGPKRGHFRFPGAAACGELVVADIDIAPKLPPVQAVSVSLTTAVLAHHLLPARPAAGHKGTFGKALIVAGSSHYWGAPVLAARAAYRVGAGLVALAVPDAIRPTVAAQLPEATYPPTHETDQFGAVGAEQLLKTAVSAQSLLIGPGMGMTLDFMETLLQNGRSLPPLIIDADGLNTLAQWPDWPQRLPPHTILTPHPGEMARLTDIPLAELKTVDRVALAQEKAADWGHILILKGAYTVVATPDGQATINPFANPILGAAGSGVVLAGCLAGLLAQGVGGRETAVLGTYLHAAAGQLAAQSLGNAGLLAGEIADHLPQIRRQLLTAPPSPGLFHSSVRHDLSGGGAAGYPDFPGNS